MMNVFLRMECYHNTNVKKGGVQSYGVWIQCHRRHVPDGIRSYAGRRRFGEPLTAKE